MTALATAERHAPAQAAWPLFGIRIRTPRLELRPVDDDLIPVLARVARQGIHDPGHMPFGNGWTDRADEDWESGFARYFWSQRGRWSVDSWALPFAVLLDGSPVGVQQLTAESFSVLRTVGTGSWLSEREQGRGLGTEMRSAVLHFGFDVLGAELAITGAFATNEGSIRVSQKIGYLANGIRRDRVRDTAVDAHLFRLPRDLWYRTTRVPVDVEGFAGCERLFGLQPTSSAEAAG